MPHIYELTSTGEPYINLARRAYHQFIDALREDKSLTFRAGDIQWLEQGLEAMDWVAKEWREAGLTKEE